MSAKNLKNTVKGSVSKVKAELTRYLRLVRDGNTVIVTDRDRPVAKIIRFEDQEKILTRPALQSVAAAMKVVELDYSSGLFPSGRFSSTEPLDVLIEDRKKGRR